VTLADCDDRALAALERLNLASETFTIAHHLWE
jgi:hypothetical protein